MRSNFFFHPVNWIAGNRDNIRKAIETLHNLDGRAESKRAFMSAIVRDHNISMTTANSAINDAEKTGAFRLHPGKKGTATAYEFNKENIKRGFLDEIVDRSKELLG